MTTREGRTVSHRNLGRAIVLVALVGLVAVPGGAPGTSSATPREIALAQFPEHQGELVVTDEYTSAHNGVTHVYLQQQHQGIDAFNAVANVNVARDGTVLSAGSSLVANLAGAVNTTSPSITAAQAAAAAAGELGLTPTAPFTILEDRGGPAREVLLSRGGIALTPIPAKLVFQPVADGAARLAWNLEIDESSQRHWWSVRVDAESGALLSKHDFVAHETTDGSSYRVFPQPTESPNHGPRALVSEPAEATASPFGWHDTNAANGAEFTTTRGNNVHAYADTVPDGVPDPLSEPEGGAGLDFDFPFDPSDEPVEYRPFAVTNLYYWNNIVHDVFYGYGFTEAAGNFQVNNYGRGGAGNDDVRAEAQDGSGTNNANFATPADGSRPRMQMFLWTPALPNAVTVNPPSSIAGDYDASAAQFGAPAIPAGVTADVSLVNDGVGAATDACEPLVGFPAGNIALLDRGTCPFTQKVQNAQNAGAVAAIVVNNVPGGPAIGMGFTVGDTRVATIAITSVMLSYNDGQRLRANLPLNATVRRKTTSEPNRDSDLDSGVIAHEYGHGISNRLTGGPSRVNCLQNAEQMGEGWSDWLALVLTARQGDTPTQNRGVGTYVVYQPTDGFGIRPTPYTTDMSVNPVTYGQIGGLAVPHGVGYAWASMLWEVYWNLVTAYGFNADVYGDWTTGGNNLAIQLVMDGMKFQPCSPGFVNGRDAILTADQALTGGDNTCTIWRAFAKRGLGFSAKQGSSASTTDGTQAFDLPTECHAGILVDPPSLSAEQIAGTQTTQTLTISNGTAGGGDDLTWSISEAATSCGTPSDVSWVSAAPASGTTPPGGRSNVTVTFDSTGLATPSSHGALLCVASNDPARPVVEVPLTLDVIYDFRGFFGSVRNPPQVNRVNAGSTVPLVFSLSGDQGMDIFPPGSPSSHEIDCDTRSPIGPSEPTLPAGGGSGLAYDASTDRYTYRWQTQGDWAATCRELTMELDDGTTKRALFRFN
jgi:hypothetical protein